MSPVTHFLVGWLTANSVTTLDRRSRATITLAGIFPDVDGFGQLIWLATGDWADYDKWYIGFHHKFGHNFLTGLLLMVLAWHMAKHAKLLTALLTGISFHLHLLCDILGSRGTDPLDLWPIFYLWPLSENPWQWAGQWPLLSWQNYAITLLCLATIIHLGRNRGYTFLEMVAPKTDLEVVQVFRKWFPGQS
ncbi:MAG: metal-dependent hydrolase [Magnetococcales bacterium]|nr:metal-dependent hydrolase [Magnetococcales bacterium]NGZ25569.1 metal-dependent hydrolase [Magnetococcales bacterium]